MLWRLVVFFLAVVAITSTGEAQIKLYQDGNELGDLEIPTHPASDRFPYTYRCYRANAGEAGDIESIFEEATIRRRRL